mgnify:CR=1 FL=1
MNDKATSVRCMLLPLTSLNLLVPNSAVAEIIGYSAPRELVDTTDWFSGVPDLDRIIADLKLEYSPARLDELKN